MIGYCSNSPLRCPHAKTIELLNQPNNCCPNCGLSLVTSSNLSKSALFELWILQTGLAVTAILLLVLVYVYYATFT